MSSDGPPNPALEFRDDPTDAQRQAFRQALEELAPEQLLEFVKADPEGVRRMTRREDGTCLTFEVFRPIIKGPVGFAPGVEPPPGIFGPQFDNRD